MKDDELIGALRAYGPILEKACVKACEQMRDGGNWSDFELRESYQEIWRLSQNRDLAYDRPSIGLHYALWYHLQRTHYLIRALTPLLRDRQNRMAIYDAGCGTGATAWAAATVTAGLADADHRVPQVDVFGKDTSPFMLEAAESLWSRLTKRIPSDVRVANNLGSWTEPPSDIEEYDDILIVCSFLLNSSDNRYLKELSRRLSQVHREIGARQLLLVCPRSKQHLATTLSSSSRWEAVPLRPLDDLWDGEIKRLNSLRKTLLFSVGQHSPQPPSWSVGARPKFLLLERHVETLTDAAHHNLDKKQERAAEPQDRLTYVVGAAGSGKSLVLCERVVRICERALPSEPPHILVTTFNKPMLEQLIIWTKQRISASTQSLTLIDIGGDSSDGDYQVGVSNARQVDCKIRFLNRDKLPTRVWQTFPNNIPVLEANGLEASAFDESADELFDIDFIDKELELVVLGMDAWEHERYVDPAITARHGRRQRLTRRQRAELWPKLVARANVTKFPEVCLHRRLAAQRYYESALASGKQVRLRDSASPITHLLVDEGQDMTRSELRLLARTPIKAQRLFVAGDTTQAIHTAGISPRPRIEGAQWEILTLVGSYRLPALVCEALQPLAENILARQSEANGSIPEVRRSAVPGPRPIIVDASRHQDMATALIAMSSFESANPLNDPDWSVICEPPGERHPLAMTLEKYDIGVKCESMLRIKGLERPLVIFPTDAVPPYDEAAEEWIYTALTRSRCVLVIALLPDTRPAVTNALCRLNQGDEYLMFWDESARAVWADMCRGSAS